VPRCTDAADQKFIDLALASRSQWLLSRDRAVLKLRRKLLDLTGCRVLRPEEWSG
jgi:predicted nucleic acid-binding protein